MRQVLDASALLAMLFKEPGGMLVADHLDTASIGSVNLAEVVTILTRRGGSSEEIIALIDTLAIPVLVAERPLAIEAGLLWATTRSAGSSLGDRYCLALARRLDATMMTADRKLAEIASTAGVAALLIRHRPAAG